MNNKLNNMLNDFFKNEDLNNEEELNKKLQEFIQKYNNEEIEYENTPLDDAYELLEKANKTFDRKEAIKLAKEAYKLCSDCFEAILLQAKLEEDIIKRHEILNKGLEYEKNRLEKEKYFDKENIGHFYGIFETRPYIRGLYIKTIFLLQDGKIKQAMRVCKEILRLNEYDNTGARYLLLAIYAYLEDEKELLDLYNIYQEETLEMLFPLFALYYKLGNDKKTNMYLKRINKANPDFLKFFKGTMKLRKDIEPGCYCKGDSSEVLMYFSQYSFLTGSIPNMAKYILKNSKESK